MTIQFQLDTPSNSLLRRLANLWDDDTGQDLIEYALIALVMGLSTVAGVHGLASSISDDLNFIVNGFGSATNGI